MKSELKIGILNFGLINGSSYYRSFLLAQNLADQGKDVTLITTSDRDRFRLKCEYSGSLKIVVFPYFFSKTLASGGFGIITSILKTKYVITCKYDIIQTDSAHRFSCWIPAFFASKITSVIHIAEWWDYYGKGGHFDRKHGFKKYTLGLYERVTEKIARKHANGIIALSQITYNRAVELGFNNKEILLLHGGADTKHFRFIPNFNYRKQFQLEGYDFVFGLVGMNSSEILDNIPLIEVLKSLDQSLKICLFTTGEKLRENLKSKLELNKHFVEFGWLDYKDLPLLLSCANAFALLQRDDLQSRSRWPNKCGDYLSAGRLLIINPVGEVSYLRDKKLPFLFWTDRSAKNLRGIILNLLDKDEHYFFDLGSKAREFAEDEISWSMKAKTLFNFYCTYFK